MNSPKLGDYVDLQRGKTYKSKLLDLPGPVLLGLATIERDGGFRRDKLRTYGGDSPKNLIVGSGELYVSLKDVTQSGDLLGAVARIPPDVGPGRLTQDTVKLIPKDRCPSLDLVYWTLRAPQYRAYCRAHATGTTNLGLPREDFLAFPMPEDIAQSSRLTSLLTALDDKIDLNRRMNETLEAMARALFKSWFVDFDPVRAKMEGRQPFGMDPATADLFPDRLVESEIGLIPEGWEVTTLESVSDLNPTSWSAKNHPEEIEYVDLSSTHAGRIADTDSYEWSKAPSRARRSLEPMDTLVGCVRPANRSFALVMSSGLTGSTGFAVLRAKARAFCSFIYLAATSQINIDRLAQLADGAAYPAVRPDVVHQSPVVLPGAQEAAAFAEIADSLLDQVGINERQSRTLAELRDLLLPKLLSGEIRVADAEKEVEAAL